METSIVEKLNLGLTLLYHIINALYIHDIKGM